MPNSLIQGTTWRWRQGLKQMPMHSHRDSEDSIQTSELYLPVSSVMQAKAILTELSQKGIVAESKRTHSTFDSIPAGSLIIYADTRLEEPRPSEKENIEKLKSYILSHGGQIVDKKDPPKVIGFLSRLFGYGEK